MLNERVDVGLERTGVHCEDRRSTQEEGLRGHGQVVDVFGRGR